MRTLLTVMTVLLLSSTMSNAQKNKTSDTQIIQDQDTGQIIIKIEGQTVGIFDKDGLTIMGSVKYDGGLIPIVKEKVQSSIGNKVTDAVTKEGGNP